MKIINENIKALMNTELGDRAMDYYNTMLEYPDMIERLEKKAELIKFKFEGDAYRDAMERLDHSRRRKHDAAMASLSTLNRIAEKSDLPAVTEPVDFSGIDRTEVADAICAHAKEMLDADRARVAKEKEHAHSHGLPVREFTMNESINEADGPDFA